LQSASPAAVPTTSAPAKQWEPYGGGYDPLNRRASAARNLPAQSDASDAASAQSHSASAHAAATMTNETKKKWEPYGGGYDPLNRRTPAMASSNKNAQKERIVQVDSFMREWMPPTGYVAGWGSEHVASEPAPAQSFSAVPAAVAMTSAPTKKWQPCTFVFVFGW